MKGKFILIFVCASLISILSPAQYSSRVKAVLEQARKNQAELKKALDYFYKSGDSLKIKSINFLIENMVIHRSYSYYWSDSKGRRIPYNELDYATFNDAVIAFNSLKEKNGKLNPVPYSYRDIDSIKADYLIENVELACQAWRKRHNKPLTLSDWTIFSEYVLPYRVAVETLVKWRKIYATQFSNAFTGNSRTDSIQLRQLINSRLKNLWGAETQSEPLPRLNALQILLRRKGYCEDLADMAVFIARSNGVPASVDNVPAWGTSTGKHFLNYLQFDKNNTHFDAVLDGLGREPGKVIRTTYSPQTSAIASWLDTSLIPEGFLRMKNYLDVTGEYWKTGDFTINLFANPVAKAVFVGVFNGGSVIPLWFAKKEGNKATFKNMGRGVIYIPFYFINHKMIPAGNPFALGYNNAMELNPDTAHKRSIVVKEQEKYLKFRAGKYYQLLIWNGQWKLHSTRIAPEGCTQLVFDNVPKKALLLLAPEYSQGKERPFIILDNGERVWW